MQDDDIPGIVRYHTYEVLKEEVNNPKLRWAYLPYSMHMAGPREAIQHMIIRKNYGVQSAHCICTPRWMTVGYEAENACIAADVQHGLLTHDSCNQACIHSTRCSCEHEAWLQGARTSSLAGIWQAARAR